VSDSLDFITVLTSVHNKGGAKQYTRSWDRSVGRYVVKERSFSGESHFSFATIPLNGPGDFFAALNRIVRQFTSIVVRGAIVPGTNLSCDRRRHHPKHQPTLADAAHHWLLTDHDDIPAPVLTDVILDPLAAVEHVIGLLPEEFCDVSCWYGLSSSAGMQPYLHPEGTSTATISLRLGWWLSEPHSNAELKRLAAKINAEAGGKLVDPCLYHPSQPHFVVAPRFIGMSDPLAGRRFGIREGLEQAVSLVIPPPHYRPPRAPVPTAYHGPGGGAAGWLAQIGKPHFLEPMKSAIACFIGDYGVDADLEPLRAAIEKAFNNAGPGGRDQETLDRYLDQVDSIADACRDYQGDVPGRLVTPEPPRELDIRAPFDIAAFPKAPDPAPLTLAARNLFPPIAAPFAPSALTENGWDDETDRLEADFSHRTSRHWESRQ
jgi:hypothetical protein